MTTEERAILAALHDAVLDIEPALLGRASTRFDRMSEVEPRHAQKLLNAFWAAHAFFEREDARENEVITQIIEAAQ